jgi:hypothetical protein
MYIKKKLFFTLMKLGVISDIHDHEDFLNNAIDKFKELNIDVLIFCGDLTKPELFKKFKRFGKVYAVKGNMDKDVEGLKQAAEEIGAKYYEDYADISLGDRQIAILHSDDQMKFGSLIESFHYDYILYGHTHQPISDVVNNANLVNPGAFESNTIAIIDLETDEVVHINLSTGKPINEEKEVEELPIDEDDDEKKEIS